MKEYVTLGLVRAMNDIVPVCFPDSVYVNVGDLVFFEYAGEKYRSEILMEKDIRVNSEEWKQTIETLHMVPINVTRYALVRECKWEEEKE